MIDSPGVGTGKFKTKTDKTVADEIFGGRFLGKEFDK